jgi:hypothetical protein
MASNVQAIVLVALSVLCVIQASVIPQIRLGITETLNDGWPVYRQDERTCNGSAPHFTGRVPVSPEKSVFFC